jgi:hypothetical protein
MGNVAACGGVLSDRVVGTYLVMEASISLADTVPLR